MILIPIADYSPILTIHLSLLTQSLSVGIEHQSFNFHVLKQDRTDHSIAEPFTLCIVHAALGPKLSFGEVIHPGVRKVSCPCTARYSASTVYTVKSLEFEVTSHAMLEHLHKLTTNYLLSNGTLDCFSFFNKFPLNPQEWWIHVEGCHRVMVHLRQPPLLCDSYSRSMVGVGRRSLSLVFVFPLHFTPPVVELNSQSFIHTEDGYQMWYIMNLFLADHIPAVPGKYERT
ncbi:hypothetical protein C8Q75DRAFT_733349 [Abortiporus biennis]|nr:hypothetical protein C8Q75DRAFT_733349 [Abortiporus biennis]